MSAVFDRSARSERSSCPVKSDHLTLDKVAAYHDLGDNGLAACSFSVTTCMIEAL